MAKFKKVFTNQLNTVCPGDNSDLALFIGTPEECQNYVNKYKDIDVIKAHGGLKIKAGAEVYIAADSSVKEDLNSDKPQFVVKHNNGKFVSPEFVVGSFNRAAKFDTKEAAIDFISEKGSDLTWDKYFKIEEVDSTGKVVECAQRAFFEEFFDDVASNSQEDFIEPEKPASRGIDYSFKYPENFDINNLGAELPKYDGDVEDILWDFCQALNKEGEAFVQNKNLAQAIIDYIPVYRVTDSTGHRYARLLGKAGVTAPKNTGMLFKKGVLKELAIEPDGSWFRIFVK